MPANLENSEVAIGLEKVSFQSNPKECSYYHTIALISHDSKVMLKILQARFQQCVNWELLDGQAGFRKGRETKDQFADIHWIIEKARDFQKNIYFCFIDYAKAFVWITTNCGISLMRFEYQHITCLLRNMYASQEATVKIGHETMDWFKIGKGVHQGCILSPCLFNLYEKYIMRNTGLGKSESGIKIAGRTINNLRYADDITLMGESVEELKSLLMKVKGKSWLKTQYSKNKDNGTRSYHFMENRWGKSVRFHFLGLQNHCGWWLQPQN